MNKIFLSILLCTGLASFSAQADNDDHCYLMSLCTYKNSYVIFRTDGFQGRDGTCTAYEGDAFARSKKLSAKCQGKFYEIVQEKLGKDGAVEAIATFMKDEFDGMAGKTDRKIKKEAENLFETSVLINI